MLTELDKQLADLAVTRFGADRARVYETLAAVRHAQAVGRHVSLLDALVERQLLNSVQARQLRLSLDDTHLDLSVNVSRAAPNPPPSSPANGVPVPRDAEDLLGLSIGLDVRTIGPYRILSLLGEGGMGAVYRAYDEAGNRYVAIKVLAEHVARNQKYLERFHREAQSVAKLNHPNIVRSLGAGHDPQSGKHYLVLEYVDGDSTQNLLEAMGRLPVGDAVHIALEVARALEHAHSRRIIHRDIKPDNILLTKSGVAKLSDLGLAKQEGEVSSLTATRQSFGTPYYMPYEQAVNARQADARSDIFALGATLYHLLTGEVPFPGESHLAIVEKKEVGDYLPARSHCPDLPEELDEVLAVMLARHPEDRYRTACDLIVALDRTGFAASVPSFVDREVALRDPLVRARLEAPAQPTQPDLTLGNKAGGKLNGTSRVLYVRLPNQKGPSEKTRLSVDEVRRQLVKGSLTLAVEASREADGVYQPLAAFPEFQRPEQRKLEIKEAETASERKRRTRPTAVAEARRQPPPPAPWSRWRPWLIGVALAGGITALALLGWWRLTP